MSTPHPTPSRLLAGLAPLWLIALAADVPSPPSIMAVMHKQYTTSRAPFKVIGRQLEARPPDWTAIEAAADRFEGLAEALAANTPRRGSPGSWRAQVAQHRAEVRALVVASREHDLERLRTTRQRIADACQACHDAHRFRREP